MIKLYFDIYLEFLKNSRFFWKSVYMYSTISSIMDVYLVMYFLLKILMLELLNVLFIMQEEYMFRKLEIKKLKILLVIVCENSIETYCIMVAYD
jgi:hypothetical protein